MKLPPSPFTPVFSTPQRLFACLILISVPIAAPVASEVITLRTDSQAEGAIGWVTQAAFTPDQAINLTQFDDWMVADNSGSVPGVHARKMGANHLSLAQIDYGMQSGANRVDPWQVYFDWIDGDPIPLFEEYRGVSWVSSRDEPYSFMLFRAEVGAQAGQIFHFWNHNLQDLPFQRLTVSLHAADGSERASREFINNVNTAYYTSIIGFEGQAEGDYVQILNIGQNVGWRATALLWGEASPPPPVETPFFFEGSEQTLLLEDSWGSNAALGHFWHGGWPWVYVQSEGAWWYASGEAEDAYYLYDSSGDWFYASTRIYPFFYSYGNEEWLTLN